MKAIMVMYDTLTRNFLEPYGCDWVQTPNFTRLAEHAVTFDCSYAGSMPCMPARRELHTGRYNFLHRSWGPLEPFDDSTPQILRENGIYTHLVSDHQHYWEDGGATYHTRYESWECTRGQEGDPWKAKIGMEPTETLFSASAAPHPIKQRLERHDAMNRAYIGTDQHKMPQDVTFTAGLDFIDENHDADDWFLQIETFDPHEPFFAQQAFRDLYLDDYDGLPADWPPYDAVLQDDDTVAHVRRLYAALITMCDTYLGKVLDKMDEYGLWDDTMLIVNTDHGFLLGEHGWWGKTMMPLYNEIVNTPLFIWDPRSKVTNVHRSSLAQTIDLPATILDYFGLPLPADMEGRPLTPVIERDEPVREYGLYGMHASYTCITDGHYTYMRGPVTMNNGENYEYTLMPTHMRAIFSPAEMREAKLVEPFRFTKDCPVLQIPVGGTECNGGYYGTKLYDVAADPGQTQVIDDPETELRLARAMVRLMNENDAPAEQYARMGLSKNPEEVTFETLAAGRAQLEADAEPGILEDLAWDREAKNILWAMMGSVPAEKRDETREAFAAWMRERGSERVTADDVRAYLKSTLDADTWQMMDYFTRLIGRDYL